MSKLRQPKPLIPNPRWLRKYHSKMFNYDNLLPAESDLPIEVMRRDLLLCIDHILQFDGSMDSMNNVRGENGRFLNWLWLVRGISLYEARRSDIIEYLDFCMFPPNQWISELTPYQFFYGENGELEQNEEWLPFSQNERARSSIEAIFSRLSSLFQQEQLLEVIGHNPVRAIRQKNKFKKRVQSGYDPKVISKDQIRYCIDTLEELCIKAESISYLELLKAERALFTFSMGLGLYLRVSEFVATELYAPTHRDFHKVDGNWFLKVIGKGNVERDITVSDDVLEALMRWRSVLELSPLPLADDRTPMFPRLDNLVWGDDGQCLKSLISCRDTLIVWRTFKGIFALARRKMCEDGKEDDAFELLTASSHWLRHTGISNDAETRPIEHIRDDAGHQSSETTMKYINATNRERAASKRNARQKS